MPGLNLPTKSVATEDENRIDDLYVLMYDTNGFVAYAKASSIKGTGAAGVTQKVTVNLPFVEQNVDLVLLANVGADGKEFVEEISYGTSKRDVYSSMTFECPDANGRTPLIPMWGECSIAGLSSSTTISATMLRAMAAVKLTITKDVLNFKLQKVSFYNVPSMGKLVPDAGAWNGVDKVTEPSVPADAGLDILSMETNSTVTFYVPEAEEGGSVSTNSYLIIKGEYDGFGTCYYRLDMLDDKGSPVSLLRNHIYAFTIAGVHAIGYTSASEAAANPASNRPQGDLPTTIEITDAASGMNEATTDGKYYLAVNASSFTLPSSGSKAVKLKVYTDVPGGWALVDLPEGVSASPSSGKANEVGFTWIWVDTEIVKSDIQFYVKAGSLWKIITIEV